MTMRGKVWICKWRVNQNDSEVQLLNQSQGRPNMKRLITIFAVILMLPLFFTLSFAHNVKSGIGTEPVKLEIEYPPKGLRNGAGGYGQCSIAGRCNA